MVRTSWPLRYWVIAAGALVGSSVWAAETVTLAANSNVIQLGPSNAAPVGPVSGSYSMMGIGIPKFGPLATDLWRSAVWQFLDSSGGIDYVRVPIGSSASRTISHGGYAFLVDGAGSLGDNSGSLGLSLIDNGDSSVDWTGTITATSNVAQQTATTMLQFFSTASLQTYNVTAEGLAYFGGSGSAQYKSVVVQFYDATGAIDYAVVGIGQSIDILGYDLRAFITDGEGTLGDNSGSLSVRVNASPTSVPEPFTMALMGAAGLTGYRKLRRRRSAAV